ncbi:hypothetical protein DITRI_Ditri02bG0018300 [Diplodiscus trichospermus]
MIYYSKLTATISVRTRPLFPVNSTYQANLNNLLSSLSSNATRGNRLFYNTTSGRNSDVVYGLYLCRGDISSSNCADCVSTARNEVTQRCPVEKIAVIWYDNCLVRYSNQSIFSIAAEAPRVYLVNTANITDQERFNQILGDSMDAAATLAINDTFSLRKFAIREANVSRFQTLYNLVQCTPDLSTADCNTCLRGAIASLPTCCSGRQGARVLTPSCNIRYEVYPFYNQTAVSVPPPPPLITPPLPPAPGKSRNSGRIIIATVVPISVSVLLFFVGCCLLKRRARKKYEAVQVENGNDISTIESLQFDFISIEAATNNFADSNKLGEGGFGEVYKHQRF